MSQHPENDVHSHGHGPSTADSHPHSHEAHHHETHDHQVHGHPVLEGENITEQNRAHWNKTAKTYSSRPWQQELLRRTDSFLQTHLSWLGLGPSLSAASEPSSTSSPRRVLDYACGPGTMTAALRPHAAEFVGVDISENMVAEYNARFGEGEGSVARAYVGNLLGETVDLNGIVPGQSLEGAFDLAVVGYGFHHFAAPKVAAERLATCLKPGGWLVIVDLAPHEPDGGVGKGVVHHGFAEDEIRGVFEGCGLDKFGAQEMEGGVEMGVGKEGEMAKRVVFMARGQKTQNKAL